MDSMGPAEEEFNVLALIKGEERYIFVYDDVSRPELIATFRDQAADPNLALSWFDAVVLTDKAREQEKACDPPQKLKGPHQGTRSRSRI